jgi:hydroxyacylglutathione hydrolase
MNQPPDIAPLCAFRDNYIWCLRGERHAAVVDPGDAQPVLDYLRRENLTLAAILNTHHHADHVGGNAELLRQYPQVPVYGPAREAVSTVTHRVSEGDTVTLPEFELEFQVLDIPGHTAGHIAYYGANLLFCGDTLFACGCGRLFEGTAQQMHASLSKLAALPEQTLMYCGHEYTLANIRFAKVVEPENETLLRRETSARAALERGRPTLPSTISLEKQTNPFLRAHEPTVIEAASRHAGRSLSDPVAVFAEVRQWKDGF